MPRQAASIEGSAPGAACGSLHFSLTHAADHAAAGAPWLYQAGAAQRITFALLYPIQAQ